MGRRFAGMLAVALVAVTGCATAGKPTGGAGSSIQLMVPDTVGWEPGGPFELPINVFNATRMMLQLSQPYPQAIEFAVYRPDGSVQCKSPRATYEQVEAWRVQRLRSLMGMPYKIDFQGSCRDIPTGAYRYEVTYRANSVGGGFSDVVWTGTLGPQGGRLLVRSGASKLKYEELVAAFEPKSPAATATEGGVTAAEADGTSGEAAKVPTVTADAATVRACVDRELAARGMNAYGDPKGTAYGSNGPPTDEYGRVLYVASRSPAIRQACGISGF